MHCIFLFVSDEDASSEHMISKRKIDLYVDYFLCPYAIISGYKSLPLTRNLVEYLSELLCVIISIICTCYFAHGFVNLSRNLALHLMFECKTGYQPYCWSWQNFTTFTYGTGKTIFNSNVCHGHLAIISPPLYAPQQVLVSLHSFKAS